MVKKSTGGSWLSYAFVVLLVVAFCFGFVSFGGKTILEQHQKLTAYLPMTVNIKDTGVKIHSAGRGGSYEPTVIYGYTLGGQTYEGHDIFPVKVVLGKNWAQSWVDRLPKGGTMIGYYNPANPQDSYLLKEATFFPYVFLLLGFLVANAILFFILGFRKPEGLIQKLVSQATEQGRHLIAEDFYTESLFKGSVVTLSLSVITGIVVFIHYMVLAWPNVGLFYTISLVVYAMLCLLGFWIKQSLQKGMRYFDPGIFTLDCETVEPGQRVNIIWDQKVKSRVGISMMELMLLYDPRYGDAGEQVYCSLFLVEKRIYYPHESVHIDKSFFMPSEEEMAKGSCWKLVLNVKLDDVPQYGHTFTLPVAEIKSDSLKNRFKKRY